MPDRGGGRSKNTGEFAIDGMLPDLVLTPRSFEQVAEIIRNADNEKLSIVPWGSGTSMARGRAPEKYDIALSLRKLDAIIELEPEDLTCSVQAGITLGELNAVLSEYGLFLPVDPPYSDTATIGGIAASNVYGPLRYQYGTIRDLLLGMHMILSDGTMVKSGGKVVKNVAGFDVHKLFIGSMGTLGIIERLNLRLMPLPAVRKTLFIGLDSIPEAVRTAEGIINSNLLPEFIVITCKGAMEKITSQTGMSAPSGTTGLFIGIDNHPRNTGWQTDEIRRMIEGKSLKCLSLLEGSANEQVRIKIREYPETLSGELILKINFLLSDFHELYRRQKELQESLPHPAFLTVNPGMGVMHLIFDDIESLSREEKDKYIWFVEYELELVESYRGKMTIEAAPQWLKERMSVSNKRHNDYLLMQTIKSGLDPNNIMSPGRLNGGWLRR